MAEKVLKSKLSPETVKTLSETISKNYSNRDIVFFGANSAIKECLLKDYGIETNLEATGIKEKVDKNRILWNTLKGKSKKYFVVVSVSSNTDKLRKSLIDYGYNEFVDFIFTKDAATKKKIIINPNSGNYADIYGNFIHSAKFSVKLGPNVRNTKIYVDDSVKTTEKCQILVYGNGGSNIVIGKNCKFSANTIKIFDNATVNIGDGFTCGKNTEIHAVSNSTINIGKDCMFSYDCQIFSGDGHAIFDTLTGNRTNDNAEKMVINIGDHVWACMRSMILNKCVIGNSSIVAAGAIVKGTFPNNCVIAGNPAKMVKKNVSWSRGRADNDISDCGEENVNLTEITDK